MARDVPAGSGAAVMAIGIVILAALQQLPFAVDGVLALGLLTLWLALAGSFAWNTLVMVGSVFYVAGLGR